MSAAIRPPPAPITYRALLDRDLPRVDLVVDLVVDLAVDLAAPDLRAGFPFRLVDAIFSSSRLLIDSYMLFETPFSSVFFLAPFFAARAAPAAICCAFDFAGMFALLSRCLSSETHQGNYVLP